MTLTPTKFWHLLPDGRIQCDLCPRGCRLHEGQRGLCFVRGRVDDQMVLTTYGRSSGFCVDPIEKKPLNHFLPGTACCRSAPPAATSRASSARTGTSRSRARWTRSVDAGDARDDLRTRAERARLPQRRVHLQRSDHLRRVRDRRRRRLPRARHQDRRGHGRLHVRRAARASSTRRSTPPTSTSRRSPRSSTARSARLTSSRCWTRCVYLVHETDVWVEITTLLIPGLNDSRRRDRRRVPSWIAGDLGADVPLHFTAFHPDYRMRDMPPTPPATLHPGPRDRASATGCSYVYTGNVHDVEGDTTSCPGCGAAVIVRDWYAMRHYALSDTGRCRDCGTQLPGVFDGPVGSWGALRRPVHIA